MVVNAEKSRFTTNNVLLDMLQIVIMIYINFTSTNESLLVYFNVFWQKKLKLIFFTEQTVGSSWVGIKMRWKWNGSEKVYVGLSIHRLF